MKERRVAAIENGTVIDHIPPENTFKVFEILNLKKCLVAIANNLNSSKISLKGIIKIADTYLSEEELNKISVLAPDATMNVIENFRIIKKQEIKVPKKFINIIQCRNPNCITRNQDIKTRFDVIKKNPLKLRCHFCENTLEKKDLRFL